MSLKRTDVLASADEIINGDRQDAYGTPEESFGRIAKLWSVLLGVEIAPWQVAQMMAALKLARSVQSPEKDDSWVDLAGYAALAAELAPIPMKEAVAAATGETAVRKIESGRIVLALRQALGDQDDVDSYGLTGSIRTSDLRVWRIFSEPSRVALITGHGSSVAVNAYEKMTR